MEIAKNKVEDKRLSIREKPEASKNLYIEEKGPEERKLFFVLDPDRPTWAFINPDGLKILNLCNGKNTIEDISRKIAEEYKIGYEDAYSRIEAFLDYMFDIEILHKGSKASKQRRFLSNPFSSLALEITANCNLRCLHCYLSAGGRKSSDNYELTLEEIKGLLRSAKEVDAKSVSIGGGEPLLRKDCFQILEYAVSMDLLVALGTNATLINRKIAKKLSELQIKIQVSMDGARRETHDYIRGKGSFDLAVKGLGNLLKEDMGKDTVIAFTPMRPNVHEVPEIINFALERGVPVIHFPPLSPSGRAKERWDELRLLDEEKLWFWDFVSKRARELKGRMDILAECLSIDINTHGLPQRCSIGSQLRIDPIGNVFPCQCFHYNSEYCLGNIRKQSLKSMLYGERIKQIKKDCFQRPLKIKECRECPWRNYCGGGCMGNAFEATGTIWNPESCNVRKEWIRKSFEAMVSEIPFEANFKEPETR